MHGIGEAMKTMFVVVFLAGSVIGWCVIELLIWLFSHISFNF
jgi:hypothetical protein